MEVNSACANRCFRLREDHRLQTKEIEAIPVVHEVDGLVDKLLW